MTALHDTFTLSGHGGKLAGHRWSGYDANYLVLLVHGYGEHLGRYEWTASRLVADGAVVFGIDHVGHGRSDGERVLITDVEPVVTDIHTLADYAISAYPGLPVVLIGHSMGGLIGARYAQRYAPELAGVVLSGPVIGRWTPVAELLAHDEIPAVPIDPATLSRDPAVGQAYETDPLVWHGAFKRPTIEALLAELDTITAAGPLPVPTLWLHGGDDQLVPIEGSREGWASIRPAVGAAEIVYPGARHEIFNETNREQVVADVLAFVHSLPITVPPARRAS